MPYGLLYICVMNLRPPDGKVFVESVEQTGKLTSCVIASVGHGVDFSVGQRVASVRPPEKVTIDGVEKNVLRDEYIEFIYG